jgi:hypothetical protein
VAVLPLDDERRFSVRALDLDDLSAALCLADAVSGHDELVPDLRVHGTHLLLERGC